MDTQPQIEPVFITELQDLLFNVFIKCKCNGDLSGLVTSGTATDEQLIEAWAVLEGKFYELANPDEAALHIRKAVKIGGISTKLLHVSALLQVMQLHPNEATIECLREWGYNRRFLPETMAADLKYIAANISSENLKLTAIQADYDKKMERDNHTGENPDRRYYIRLLHAIENYLKMTFDQSKLNMEAFAMRLADLVEISKQINRTHAR